MELKEGMYVRTNGGSIFKLGYYDEKGKRWISVEEYDWYPVYESSVAKASNNIIDLIEVGDYVNGSKVMNIVEEDGTRYLLLDRDEVYYDSCLEPSSDKDIKSILTKEQFENMSYKVIQL